MKLYVLFTIFTPLASILVSLCNAQEDIDGFCPIDKPKECVENSDTELVPKCYRAAVVEHNRIDLEDIEKTVEANLAVFRSIAQLAAEKGARVVVFPEDGLFIAKVRQDVFKVLTEIPDPSQLDDSNNNPCLHGPESDTSYILREFSCIARQNSIYLVANFGTKQTCQPAQKTGNLTCPEEGFFSFNTNVVLSPSGLFLKRYRKYNTFLEIFHEAPSLELVHFDTIYGRFGIFTCFDLMFKSPAIDLIEKDNIDTAIFPTWWYDELPILSAIQFQDGWSWTNNVNLLASNIQRRLLGSTGSGIFNQNNSVYTSAASKNSKLIVANLPIGKGGKCVDGFQSEIVDIPSEQEVPEYIHKHYDLLETDTVQVVKDYEASDVVCAKEFCCSFDYKIKTQVDRGILSKLVLIVRDSRRPGRYEWYEQVCFFATLATPYEEKEYHSTKFSRDSLVEFDRLLIKSTFQTKYVYPIAAHSVSELVSRKEREFICDTVDPSLKEELHHQTTCGLRFLPTERSKSLYSFGMYARVYEKDKSVR